MVKYSRFFLSSYSFSSSWDSPFFYKHLTEDVRVRSLHKASEGERASERRREEKRVEKKRVREKRYEHTLSLSLSSSPSFGYSTTYAEVGRRTRERERDKEKKYIEKKSSYDLSYLSLLTTTTTAVRTKQC